ncbi:tripartite ATP-independent transporter solute receptor, DctP family [Desulfacinum infernum DSM 9756]|uniref:Tripartite ATP-independent transporter solute receptor, DctP family n=1 Tax=Desulfacinum infernum DSM 9756 TaxID=1121391 RepID=A0A1M5FEN3_9BACT|nr:DctP family TRAP transporter solute-binding subunit [Desulfacinum infernum]SHF89899.1 tripartite ATP-independent transporter solute receptor, DctP family [Desulfacinum infernum DSM 9756]
MKRGVLTAVLVFAAAMAVVFSPVWAADYKAEYKMSIVVGPKGPWGEGAQMFADLVRERTNGRINIKCYFAGQLFAGKQTNEFLLMRQGVIDFALASTINWSPQVPSLNLFALPFFFEDYEQLDAVKNGAPGQELFRQIEEKGVVGLAWGENGFRELTNRKQAVDSPDDLEGLKVRVVGSPIFIDTFRALGANPINMNWGEAQTAFQQGTVDGQENPVNAVIIPYQLWQVHKYISIWHYAIDPLILGVSKKTWDSFSPEDQAILKQAAADACAWEVAQARKGLEGDMPALQTLRDNGMEVTVFTPEIRAAFREKTRSVYDEWRKKIGEDLVAQAEKILGR